MKDFIDYLTGRLSDPPQEVLGLLKTQKIGDLLAPLMKYKIIAYQDGLLSYPPDYDWFIDLRITGDPNWKPEPCNELPKYTIDQIMNGQNGFRQVDILSHDEISSRVNTRIPLLKKVPVGEQYDKGFLLYNTPSPNGTVFLAYVIEPPKIVLNMSNDPNTNTPVYQSNGSVNPSVDEKAGPFLARKIADLYFVFVREGDPIAMLDAAAKTK
jgi:hypothetical protein